MKVWTVIRLWTYEFEYPRIEEYVYDSEDKAIIKAKQLIADDQEVDPDFWVNEDLIIDGDIEKRHFLEIFLDGQINTTFVGYYIRKLEVE